MVKYYHDKTPKIQCFVKDTFMLQAAPEGESQNQNDTEVLVPVCVRDEAFQICEESTESGRWECTLLKLL